MNPGLNVDRIRSFKISTPRFAEQLRIAANRGELTVLCDRLEGPLITLTSCRQLLKATLQVALSEPGKLQDVPT